MCILKLTKLWSHSHIIEGLISLLGSCCFLFLYYFIWSWNSNTLATWCKELTHWKRPWCWESLRVGGEGDDREWDGWMASLTQRTWVWASFGSWLWTGKPGMLQSMGSQRVRHNWAAELNWTDCFIWNCSFRCKHSLFLSFFFFYIYVRFKSTMICPFSGDSRQYSYRP